MQRNKINIKVCGMRDPVNIQEVSSLSPQYMGFIFYDQSPRFAGNLTTKLPSNVKKTGVFVNAALEDVAEKIELFGLDAVQLHGNESADYCKQLKTAQSIEVIKAFGINDTFDFKDLEIYEHFVDFYLFDTFTPVHGGSGKVFNWSSLSGYKGNKAYFLSGGIDLEHLEAIRSISDTRLFAVDINSRFETEPGLKNTEKVRQFITQLNA